MHRACRGLNPNTILFNSIPFYSVQKTLFCASFQEPGHMVTNLHCTVTFRGPGSSVGIATELRAGRSGIESRWDEIFRPSRPALGAHPASCIMGTGPFPGVKCGRGLLLITHSLLVPQSWKSRIIPLPTLWATPGL